MNLRNLTMIGSALLLSAPAFASTYYGGFEDTIGGDYDYNDVVFSLSGSGLNLITHTGTYISKPALGTNDNPFWNNSSYDGSKYNVGYCMYGGGNCNNGNALDPSGLALVNASDHKSSVGDVYFSVGGNVTADGYLKITADNDTLGYYLLSDPNHTFHQLAPNSNGIVSFTPGSDFGIAANNGSQTFYSQDWLGTCDPNGDSHFAFFSNAPEPGAMSLMAAGLVGLGVLFRRRKGASTN